MNILLAVDGSEFTTRVVNFLSNFIGDYKNVPTVHLLYVHAPIPAGFAASRARSLLGSDVVNEYYSDEAKVALAKAEDILRGKNVAFTAEFKIGEPALEISDYSDKNKIDMIIMGSHGHSALGSMILGSVTSKVLAISKAPVLIIR